MGSEGPPILFIFDCFGYSGCLLIPYEFQDQLVDFYKGLSKFSIVRRGILDLDSNPASSTYRCLI